MFRRSRKFFTGTAQKAQFNLLFLSDFPRTFSVNGKTKPKLFSGLFATHIHTNFIQDVNKLIYRKNIILKDILKRELRG